jgi:hypothetical protein
VRKRRRPQNKQVLRSAFFVQAFNEMNNEGAADQLDARRVAAALRFRSLGLQIKVPVRAKESDTATK